MSTATFITFIILMVIEALLLAAIIGIGSTVSVLRDRVERLEQQWRDNEGLRDR